MDAAALKEHEEVTEIKNVGTLELGKYQMDTWYFLPLPRELTSKENRGMVKMLYVDEFSLIFFLKKEKLLRYQRKTLGLDGGGGGDDNRKRGKGGERRHLPGNEIYRCRNLSSECFFGYSFGVGTCVSLLFWQCRQTKHSFFADIDTTI